jgi:hypothetical protein
MSQTAEAELTLQRLLRLLDLSRDLERNHEDSAFVRGREGEIVHVLDENVFEMFIHPHEKRAQVATFYADLWSDSDGDDLAQWRGFEAQAAMIAAECLVARRMPGGSDLTLYMTEPHRYELAARATEMQEVALSELRQRVSAARRDQRHKLVLLRSMLRAAAANEAVLPPADLPAALAADLNELRVGRVGESALTRLMVARLAAEVLTEDRALEPLQQLRRVLTPPIRNRIATLQPAAPLSALDVQSIHVEAQAWYRRLVEELGRPGNAQRTRKPDSRSLWNDARSIAFIRHVVLRTGSRRRILFVTGDALVFNAYRRWHASADPSASHYGEPFFMRRVVQYSPIFNPVDSGGDLRLRALEGERSAALFDRMQQAVEALLLPLVSFVGVGSSDGISQGTERERLALRLADYSKLADDPKLTAFAEKLGREWTRTERQRLLEIRDLWHQSQRLAIGASYDIIAPRMDEERLTIAEGTLADNDAGGNASLFQYASTILERLLDDTMQLWEPLAKTFGFDGPGGRPRRRGPERLAFAMDMDAIGQTSRAAVFAGAARRALELEEFANAERFANLASRSFGNRADAVQDRPSLELQYLHALTLKFLIGTIKPELSGATEPQKVALRVALRVKHVHAQAARLLRNCLSEHFEGWVKEAKTGPAEQSVLYLRALSELASLNLFAATSLGLALTDDTDLRQDATYFLRLARADLRRCVREEWSLARTGWMIEAVRSQFMHNLASAEVLTFLFSQPEEYELPDWLRPFVRRIVELRQERDLHPVLAAELDAFIAMAGPLARPAAGKARGAPPPAAVSVSSPLDAELLRRIHRTSFVLSA